MEINEMKRAWTVVLLVLSTCVYSQHFLDRSQGSWKGTGSLFGEKATFTMEWDLALADAFYRLNFSNRIDGQEGGTPFRAVAYYKVYNDSLILGTWFDTRGITLPLKGVLGPNYLRVQWGTAETEQGNTTYSLGTDGRIKVQDFVRKGNGLTSFGQASYTLE